MRRFFLVVFFLCGLRAGAQFKVSVSAARPFKPNAEKGFFSYSNEWNDFLLFKRIENTEQIFGLVMTDDADEILLTSDLRVATQVGDNHFTLAGLALAGRNLTAFVQSHNRVTGRNVMAMQAVDNKGGLTSEGMLVGYFDFRAPDDPGLWHIVSSPDRQHIALIAQLPHEQGKPQQFKYFFINENLTITHKGDFSIAGTENDPLRLRYFLASDKGELYLLTEGDARNFYFPAIYSVSVQTEQCNPMPLRGAGAGQMECGAFRAVVDAEGQLTVAGYLRKGGQAPAVAVGAWSFSASGNQGLRTGLFEKPVAVLDAADLLTNGGFSFLIGRVSSGFHVTGLDADGNKKFELPVKRGTGSAAEGTGVDLFNPESGIAAGIIGQKLCLVYNDRTAGGPSPLLLAVGADGRPDSPQDLGREVGANALLLPAFFSANADHIVVPAQTEAGVRIVTIR